jgi:methionine synthase II (cobalamin-independent)
LGNPNEQSFYWDRPSYARALPLFLDVVMLEGGSNQARDAALLKNVKTDQKIAIDVVDRTRTTVESPEMVADTISFDAISPGRAFRNR